MSDLNVSIECQGERITVRAEVAGAIAEAEVKQPPGVLLADILAQLHARSTPAGAYRLAGEHLGDILFAGAVGDLLRNRIAVDAEQTLVLTLDPRVAEWPWELVIDPQDGRHPVAHGLEVVRLAGEPVPKRSIPAVGYLAVPEAEGHVRLEALEAATRHLGRKAKLDIRPVVPATGPNLRGTLEAGATLIHLTGVEEDGGVDLDDGRVPIERVGLSDQAWLTVLDGRGTTVPAARRLRRNGSALVLAQQIELRANERAAVDREFYRALASGAPLLDAVRRTRRALLRTAGEDGCLWAAPTLWSAPSDGGTPVFAANFPPPKRLDSAIATVAPATPKPEPRSPYPDLDGPVGVVVPAAVFVHDTLHVLRLGKGGPDTEARLTALHALAGDALVEDAQLPPEQLVDRMVEAISRADLPLLAPDDIGGFAEGIAARAGVGADSAEQVVRALLVGRACWLTDGDEGAAVRLARYVAEAFGYHPITPAWREAPVVGATPAGPHGAAFRAIATNWRREELDPAHAAHPDPSHRVPVMARSREQWQPRRGTWLVVPAAHRHPPEVIDALLQAQTERELWFTDAAGRAQRMAVPADFRVLFIGAPPYTDPVSPLPVIAPTAPELEPEIARWLAYADKIAGPTEDAEEADGRSALARRVRAAVDLARLAGPVPTDVGALALAHALAGNLDDALATHLAPVLHRRAPAARQLLADWLDGGPKAVKVAAWRETEGGADIDLPAEIPPAIGSLPRFKAALA